ncbi:MAG TPA: gliding motility-associated C-terminal domain-containing protein [Pedobacter sp.]|nr:gliding motility-associated C-terminal domain-containing protein [Pedobacter sp.]
MKLVAFLFFTLFVASLNGFSQAQVSFGLQGWTVYAEDKEWKKVIVCKDDESVWALTTSGMVYYKQATSLVFTEFGPTAGMQVTDLAGYSMDQMYFLLASNVLNYCENQGAMQPLDMLSAGTLSGVAVVNGEENVYLSGSFFRGIQDWLLVAGSTGMRSVLKISPATSSIYGPVSLIMNWRITNSGFKSIDLQGKNTAVDPCFGNLEYSYYNGSSERIVMPETSPYGGINCTYIEGSFNRAVDGELLLDYWGTNQGLFVKKAKSCGVDRIKRIKETLKFNDLEELNPARQLFNFKLMLAATSDGLYFSSSPVEWTPANFDERLDQLSFVRYNIDMGKANSIASGVKSTESVLSENAYNLCEQDVWVAAENGIYKLTMAPGRIDSDFADREETTPIITVSPGNGGTLHNLCNGQQYQLSVELPGLDRSDYTIRWFMDEERYSDRRERTEWFNQSSLILDSRGLYGVEITYGCGNVIATRGIWLRKVPDPVFSINTEFANEILLCQGGNLELTTKQTEDRGLDPYEFRWLKDGVVISGQTSNKYQATTAGEYVVQIKNCVGDYVSSKTINVTEQVLVTPQITRSSNKSLCFGEIVKLSAPDVVGASYKWSNAATTREIEVSTSGNYTVDVIYGAGCTQRSATVSIVVNPELRLDAPPEVQICTMREQKINLSGPAGFVKYTWDGIPGGAAALEVSGPGQHKLEVEDASGCKAEVLYIVVPNCPPLIPPNVFSPNGDGKNDTWRLEGLEDHPETVVRVYNRYGELVFEGKGTRPVWDGKLKGADVPVGVYYYVVTNKQSDGMTGSLTLIR